MVPGTRFQFAQIGAARRTDRSGLWCFLSALDKNLQIFKNHQKSIKNIRRSTKQMSELRMSELQMSELHLSAGCPAFMCNSRRVDRHRRADRAPVTISANRDLSKGPREDPKGAPRRPRAPREAQEGPGALHYMNWVIVNHNLYEYFDHT